MDAKKPIGKRHSIRKIVLTEDELNHIQNLKDYRSNTILYGPTIKTMQIEICFANLVKQIHNSNTLYYLLRINNPEMIKHTKIIIDLHNHFKHYFSINYIQKGKKEILVQIKQKRKTTRALKESAFLLITTILRAMDQENSHTWKNIETTIKTVQDMIYFFYQREQFGHHIWDGFKNYEKSVTHEDIKKYLNTIKTVFAEPNYDLEKDNIGENIRKNWQRGLGINYAFEVAKKITENK